MTARGYSFKARRTSPAFRASAEHTCLIAASRVRQERPASAVETKEARSQHARRRALATRTVTIPIFRCAKAVLRATRNTACSARRRMSRATRNSERTERRSHDDGHARQSSDRLFDRSSTAGLDRRRALARRGSRLRRRKWWGHRHRGIRQQRQGGNGDSRYDRCRWSCGDLRLGRNGCLRGRLHERTHLLWQRLRESPE